MKGIEIPQADKGGSGKASWEHSSFPGWYVAWCGDHKAWGVGEGPAPEEL